MKNVTIALLLTTTPALADITPDDVLESWRTFYAGFEATITVGNSQTNDKTTRLGNVLSQMNMANAETSYHFDWIDMRSNPDGSVDISFSPEGSTVSYGDLPDGTTTTAQASYDLAALAIHATGTPGDIHYTYSAPVITIGQTQSMSGMDTSISTTFEGVSGEVDSFIEITESGPRVKDSASFQIENTTGTFTNKFLAATSTTVEFSTQANSFTYEIEFPQKPIPESPGSISMFPPNMDLQMDYLTGPFRAVMDQDSTVEQSRFEFIHDSGALSVGFSRNMLNYSVSSEGAQMQLTNTSPIAPNFTAGFGHALMAVTLPIAKSDTPAHFSLTTELSGFTLGEEVWAGFDPAGTLSHAPAGFSFSISGSVKLLVDFFDETALANLRSAPAEIRSLSLDSLSVDFEGMGLSGDGDVTFNNNRIDPMSGLPEPTGVLDFSITGALGLLDKIGKLGIGDPMMIMGAKGALGMFATPASGPDSFTSRVEFSEGGHISVNGQQVK